MFRTLTTDAIRINLASTKVLGRCLGAMTEIERADES